MHKLISDLFTAKSLSVALVIEVGFIIGLYVGRHELSAFQWGGAALAMIGAVIFAAIVFAWPQPAIAGERSRQDV